jgi:hypothetical protein
VDQKHSYTALALTLFALIVLRQGLAWPPVFGGEFIIEDFALVLILTSTVVPPRFKLAIWRAISCSLSSVMALMAWTARSRRPVSEAVGLAAFFGLFAVYSAGLGIKELLRLRKRRPIPN